MDSAGVGKIITISQAVFEGMTPKTDEECAKYLPGQRMGGCRCDQDSDCYMSKYAFVTIITKYAFVTMLVSIFKKKIISYLVHFSSTCQLSLQPFIIFGRGSSFLPFPFFNILSFVLAVSFHIAIHQFMILVMKSMVLLFCLHCCETNFELLLLLFHL